jgi:uncharacterized membrane protein SirB2
MSMNTLETLTLVSIIGGLCLFWLRFEHRMTKQETLLKILVKICPKMGKLQLDDEEC